MKHALAGVCPDVWKRRHESQSLGNAVSADEGGALRRQRADVPVRSLERSFPILVPAIVRVENARGQRPLRQHQSVVGCLSGG